MKKTSLVLLTFVLALSLCPTLSAQAATDPYTGESVEFAPEDSELIAQFIADAASGEVYLVRLALASVVVNRMTVYGQSASYVCGELRETHRLREFEVCDGDKRAAVMALCGVDPTSGAMNFTSPRDQIKVPEAALLLKAEGFRFY